MTLLAWLTCSIVFSLIGTGGLLLVRRLVRQPLVMRSLAWAVIWVSLLLPLAFSPFRGAHTHTHAQPSTVGEFCHCRVPDAGDHIRFQANRGYDLLLHHHREVMLVWLAVGASLFLPFLIRSVRTLRTLRRAEAQQVHSGGLRYHQLTDLPRLPVGAVGLRRRYLHWHSRLNALPAPLQQAIRVHEETHLRQMHTWERVAMAVLGIVWWANPAWHLLRRELILQAEFAADEAAARTLGDRKAYAALLLQLRSPQSSSVMMAFSRPSQTGRRIRHLLGQRRASPLQLAAAGLLFAIALCGDAYAGNALRSEWEQMHVYQLLNRTHQATGKTEFCKTCAFENAAAECSE